MGNLFTSLLNATQSLTVYSRALDVVSNDVTNASTPGYVKQTATFEALPFDLSVGLPGGVAAGPVTSSRDPYAEQNVRNQQSSLGLVQEQTSSLSPLQSLFDLSGKTGIGPAVDKLFNSFSALSVSPNDSNARQNVITQAGLVAQQFQNTANGLGQARTQAGDQSQSIVDQINTLAGKIAQINTGLAHDPAGSKDAGIDATLNSTLENLSQYVNFSALQQPDGGVNIYLGGQTPLVVLDKSFSIQANNSGPQIGVVDSQGRDITSQVSGGQLGGVLDVANNKIPSYQSGLNTLAQSLADRVNTTLSSGVDVNNTAPVHNLFTYNSSADAAATLAVNPNITTDEIAAALPGAPGGNGNALALSALANAKTVNGSTFAQAYGTLGGQVGQDVAAATDNQNTNQQLLTQAQSLRSQESGVSLNEEAERLIEFQRGYQASTKLITVLNSLTDSLINIIQ